MTLEKELLDCLTNLADNADEDTPHEYRTKHFDSALEDAREIIERIKHG